MTLSRRTTLKAIGVAGGLGIASGRVFAVGEHEDDERDPETDEAPMEPDADPASAVRVAHFSPDAPNVDIYVDDDQVLADVPYGTVSEYLEIEPGAYQVRITAAGDPETVAFEDEVAVEEGYYTVAAIGELEQETFEPLVLADADEAPENQGLVRLAHASPDAPAVDVVTDGTPLFEGAAFGDATEYIEVEPGAYTLDVFPAGDVEDDPDADGVDPETDDEYDGDDYNDDCGEEPVEEEVPEEEPVEEEVPVEDEEPVASFDVEVEAGTAYTGYAIGYLDPEAAGAEADTAFTLEVTVDGETGPEDDPAEPEEAPEVEDEPVEDEPDDEYDEAEPGPEDEPDDEYDEAEPALADE